jgi:RHS repeat-associated protein
MDPGGELVYMQQRYYDPVMMRFLSPDPIGTSAQNFNLYWYANNNPYTFVDPDGRHPTTGSRLPVDGGSAAVKSFPSTEDEELRRTREPARAAVRQAAETLDTVGDVAEEIYYQAAGVGFFARLGSLLRFGRSAPNINPNKVNHVFGEASHKLDDLVRASGGSQEAAYRAVQEAANLALRQGKLLTGPNGILPGGQAGHVLRVNGVNVQLVGGRVVDGKVHIGSFSRRFLSD